MRGVDTAAHPVAVENGVDGAVLAEAERLLRGQVSVQRLLPGAALAVSHRGRLVLDITAGYADTQRGRPVDSRTLFPLVSWLTWGFPSRRGRSVPPWSKETVKKRRSPRLVIPRARTVAGAT